MHLAEVYRKTAANALKYENYGRASFVARLLEDHLRRCGAFERWPFLIKMRHHLEGRWHGAPSLEDVLATAAVRQWLLSAARQRGVLSKDCISPFFPVEGEEPRENAQRAWDLLLPFNEAMPQEVFDHFCEFALSIGLKLLKRELAQTKRRRAV